MNRAMDKSERIALAIGFALTLIFAAGYGYVLLIHLWN